MDALEKIEQEFEKEVPAIIAEAEKFQVTNDAQFHEASERAVDCSNRLKKILEFFKPMKETTRSAWMAVCSRENMFAPAMEKAKKTYTDKAAQYQWKKQQEQEAKERAAQEAAEKKEQERKDKIDAEIKAAQAAGDTSKVDKLEEKKENVYVAPRAVQQAPRSNGLSVQTVWEPQIVDETKVPIQWRGEIDITRLKRAKALDKTLEVPGIKFIQKAQGAARTAVARA